MSAAVQRYMDKSYMACCMVLQNWSLRQRIDRMPEMYLIRAKSEWVSERVSDRVSECVRE